MPEPTVTFTTAFIDLNEDRSKDKTPEVRIAHFRELVKSGISICLYVSSTYEIIGKKLEKEYENIKLMPIINLEELETYKVIKTYELGGGEGLGLELPTNRNSTKDTLNYMILQNAKSEFVYKTIISNPFNTEHFAWIDFSICHILTDTEIILKQLYNYGTSQINLSNKILFPTCFSLEKSKTYFNILTTHIVWRFCGGFFIGDKCASITMYFLMLNELPNIIKHTGKNIIAWEVNSWSWLELKCGWQIESYQADHNNSILDIPRKYINTILDTTNLDTTNLQTARQGNVNLIYDYKTKYKSTIVTFYFNLKDLKDSTNLVRPQSFYMEKGIETLKLKYPMVIFCDNTTYSIIKQIRDKYITDDTLTKYIIKNITDYNFYKDNIDKIINNRKDIEYYKGNRNTPSYYLVCMFKIIAISISKEKNFFNTNYYAWVDFGCSHIVRDFNNSIIKMLDNPKPKITLCYIHYRTKNEMYILINTIGGFCGIAAAIFTLEKEYILDFYNNIFTIFYELLNNNIGHAEEQILTLFYDKYPELCTINYGDYYSILTNYHDIIEDIDCIINFYINEAIKKGRNDLAVECAKSIMKSVNKNNITIDQHKVTFLETLIYKDKIKMYGIANTTKMSKSIIHNYINKIIYINLDAKIDKKEEIETELNNFNIEYEKVNAFIRPDYNIIDCTKSHLEIIKMAKQNNYKNILILEDNFTFIVSKEKFEEQIELLFKSNVNFDICMLSYNLIKYKTNDEHTFLHNVLEAQSTSGYIVNENMYDILIELYTWALPLLNSTRYHWISSLDQIWKLLQPIKKWYCFSERLGKQRM